MAVQARAKATRQRIVATAVNLFYEVGYGTVSLSDISAAAGITTGAVYYNFECKEELAAEIIRQAWPLWWEIVEQHAARTPALENVIEMSFELSDLLRRNRTAHVGQNLNLALFQHHDGVRSFEAEGTRASFATIAAMIAPGDLREDITAEEMAAQSSMNIFGCHVLSGRMGDSAIDRMARSWRTLLRGTVPADRLPHFEQFVAGTAARYG